MRHLYIHVPFCRRRCSYCDFAIAVRREPPAPRYVDAVLRELRLKLGSGWWRGQPIETLYVGGGTPSLLPSESLVRLVSNVLTDVGSRSTDLEITVEANPDDVTPMVAEAWVRAGVNRVSLGVQSFHASALEWMHRTHAAGASARAVRTLRAAGISSVSLDLIFGLPRQLQTDFRADLEQAVALDPDHLSAYALTSEPRTPLARWISRGQVQPAPERDVEEEFLLAHDVLTQAGFEHYEVSNYARPHHVSRHNSAYWSGTPYVGLGPSAHSFTGEARCWNVPQWTAYVHAIDDNRDPMQEREELTPEQQRLERAYLGLRTAAGVSAELLEGLEGATARAAASAGWLLVDGGRVRATPLGWLRLEELTTTLTGEPGVG